MPKYSTDKRKEDTSRYTYRSVDGTKYTILAGENDVTEEWICVMREMDYCDYWQLRRHCSYCHGGDNDWAISQLIAPEEGPREPPERWIRFVAAWHDLTPGQKEAILAVKVHGESIVGFARRMNIKHSSARERVVRAIQQLSNALK